MNLGDFRRRAARVSGMSTSASGDLTDLDSWSNEAVIQFLRDTKVNMQKASLAVTAGSGSYHLDTDILSFTDVWMESADGNQSVVLEPIGSSEITRREIFESADPGTSRFYALKGHNLLQLFPVPASDDDTLHLLYVPRPANAMTATDHTPETGSYGNIPSEYHPLLEAYVKWKACEAEEHKPSQNGLQFQAEYERGVSKVRADLNRKAGVLKSRAQVGRRRIGPSTPGSDWR